MSIYEHLCPGECELSDNEAGLSLIELVVAMFLLLLLLSILVPIGAILEPAMINSTSGANSASSATTLIQVLSERLSGAQPVGWCPSAAPNLNQSTPDSACLTPGVAPPSEPFVFVSYEPNNVANSPGQSLPTLTGWANYASCPTSSGVIDNPIACVNVGQSGGGGGTALSSMVLGFYAYIESSASHITSSPTLDAPPQEIWVYVDPATSQLMEDVYDAANGSTFSNPTYNLSTPTSHVVLGTLAKTTASSVFHCYNLFSQDVTPQVSLTSINNPISGAETTLNSNSLSKAVVSISFVANLNTSSSQSLPIGFNVMLSSVLIQASREWSNQATIGVERTG